MMKPTGSLSNVSGTLRLHNRKKFRLRAVSTEFEIYSKYFKSSIARTISYIQIIIAAIITSAQICTMSLMTSYTLNEYMGIGIISSVLVGFAAGTTILASHKPTYCKLHSAMALNIITMVSHIILLLVAFQDGIPRLNRSLSYTINENNKEDVYETVSSPDPYDPYSYNSNIIRTTQYKNKNLEPVGLIGAKLFLTAVLSLGGLLQTVISFVMMSMTGRAICCGRTNLEGKLFEMEAISIPSKPVLDSHRDNVITNKEKQHDDSGKKQVLCEDKDESMDDVNLSSPPSYESGCFHSSNETVVVVKE